MDLVTLTHTRPNGWSVPLPTVLDSPSTLVVAFGASEPTDAGAALASLRAAFPRSLLTGCSTAGQIAGTSLFDDGLTVAVIRFARTRLRSVSAPVSEPRGSFAAGSALGSALAGPELRGAFIMSDGLKVNGSELVRGLSSVLPRRVIITGGLAGDGDRFRTTWVIDKGVSCGQTVTAVGFYGDSVVIGHGSKGGWDLLGPERLVTRSEANTLYELDWKPALQLYKEYLGERAAGLPATALLFPLAIRAEGAPDGRIVRTVLAVDEAQQAMVFAGDIPQGARVQLMRANFDRLIEGASGAAGMACLRGQGSLPMLSVAISCVGRRLVLGERTEEELEATLDVLPVGTQQVGLYSYGEISPYTDGTCDLHNQTMTLTTISERI